MTRAAILLSTDYFEDFYERHLGLTVNEYMQSYRAEWSWDYCRMLRSHGIEAILYIPSLRYTGRFSTADGYSIRFLELNRLAQLWSNVRGIGRHRLGRYTSQAINALGFTSELGIALVEDDVNVLCIQGYWSARFDLLARSVKIPLIAVDQGASLEYEIDVLKGTTLPRAAAIITQTETERRRLAPYGVKATRIPNAVDSVFFCPGQASPAQRRTMILAVARLYDSQKRISDAIRATALLPSDWRLEIIGSGPDRKTLERLVQGFGVSRRVRFQGFLPTRDEIREKYRECSVFVLPSAYEGLPMALLEAMSCGAAVVGSAIPAIAEVIADGEDGALVPVGNPAALAAGAREAFAQREVFGAKARQKIERFYSHEVIGPRLAEVFRRAARHE
jgi:glycosyltransferase involved in cell wall biosynthesis